MHGIRSIGRFSCTLHKVLLAAVLLLWLWVVLSAVAFVVAGTITMLIGLVGSGSLALNTGMVVVITGSLWALVVAVRVGWRTANEWFGDPG